MCPSSHSELEPLAHEPLARGTEIGRFVVLGLVGRGGMGEVYAAHDPELDRKVAIKLLRARTRRGDQSDDGRVRLMREAQAIAKVSHPNVVVVYDVGTFEGRVFIAMEFIEGNTLGYWMQVKPRTHTEILEVFAAAGRGLAAAHEKELVHRDFKPENVMVGAQGQVRVMDFGLVRLTTGDRGDRPQVPTAAPAAPVDSTTPTPPIRAVPIGDSTISVDPHSTRILDSPGALGVSVNSDALTWNLTRTGAIMGTPAYMSPEQFRGDPADARTDQFSFCVALYEALYGERPFGGATISELTSNVTEGRVKPPPATSKVAASVRRALMRGMSVDPAARFPSMRGLLGELEREQTLTGVRRFADGAAGKLAGVWEVPDADRPGDTAAKAQIRRAFLATGKPYAAATFEAVNRVLDRFARRWTELYVDACEAAHVRGEQSTEVLDLRMTALAEALEDLRALCRELRHADGETIENAVNAANALGTLERCADVKLLRAIVRPPDHPDIRAAVERLQIRLAEVRALARVGRVADGLKAVVSLEEEARVVGYAPLLAEVLFTSGMMHFYVADMDASVRTLEEAAWTAELCRHDEAAAEATASLIFVTGHVQMRFDAGEIWSRHAETVLRRMGGHDLVRGWLFNNRGAMRAAQGRFREAFEDMHRAIEAKEKALGPDDPDVALSIGNAAIHLDELGETEKAAEYSRRAVGILASTVGLDHPKAAAPLANYAELLNRLGRFEEARATAERAVAVFARESDPEGLFISYALTALGLSHLGLGRFAHARVPLERAVAIRDAKENTPAKRAEVRFALARALWGAGEEMARARELAASARAEYTGTPATASAQRELAEIEAWLATHAEPGAEPEGAVRATI